MLAKTLFLAALLLFAIINLSGAPTPKFLSAQSTTTDMSAIHWQPCNQLVFADWFDTYAMNIDALQCATIEVPLADSIALQGLEASNPKKPPQSADNQNPALLSTTAQSAIPSPTTPTTLKLAVSRLPATGQKLGSLISIAGGPGQSGLDVSPIGSAAYDRLSTHFDIIGFAPRGVYPSTPPVICYPERRILHPEDNQAFAKGCWQHTPSDLLARLGADYAVGDIEAIRQALNEPKINLIGYSYGTKIAALYAERYPDKLRAGVLDGVVNLNEGEFEMQLNQEASVQQTFERFVDECRRQPNCFFSDTSTLADAEAKIAKIFRYFDDHEVRDLDGQRIAPIHISWTLYGLMAWPDYWPTLNEVLQQLAVQDFSLLKLLIDEDKKSIDFPTFTAIDCADRAPTPAEKQRYLQDSKRIDAQSTWDNHRQPTKEELLDACYYWPIAGSDSPHAPRLKPNAPTLLLVAQTNDPATPYRNALAMQQYLNAALLTRKGDGHTLALSDLSRCVDEHVVDYLIDPGSIKKYKDVANGNQIDIVCEN